jgi:hypothetical protein
VQFTGTQTITADEFAHAAELAGPTRVAMLNIAGLAVTLIILLLIGWSFVFYVGEVVQAPNLLLEHMSFGRFGKEMGILSWLSLTVTMLLPVFLFYVLRALVEAFRPARGIRRLIKDSDMLGPTTYVIDDKGVRATVVHGPETFIPWESFDRARQDATMVILMRKGQLRLFVPLAAFGEARDAVVAYMASRLETSGPQGMHQGSSPSPAS